MYSLGASPFATSLSTKSSLLSNDSIRVFVDSVAFLVKRGNTKKGVLKMDENIVPWNESVQTKAASFTKPRNPAGSAL